jgi:succinate dehydrogenase / fumarate reductase cytochrome b subunit
MYQPDRGLRSALTSWIPFGFGGSYRYFTGSMAYVLHRITGLGLVFFIFFHILSVTKATNADPSHYDLMIRRMQEPDFKLGEIMLWGALLFHGLNGVRILVVDFVLDHTHINKRLLYAVFAVTTLLFVVGAVELLLHTNVKPFFNEILPSGAK